MIRFPCRNIWRTFNVLSVWINCQIFLEKQNHSTHAGFKGPWLYEGGGGGALWEEQRQDEEGSRHPLSDPVTPSHGPWRAAPAPLTSLLRISLWAPSPAQWPRTTQSSALCSGPLGFLGRYWPLTAFVVPFMQDSPRSKCKEISRQSRNRGYACNRPTWWMLMDVCQLLDVI